ncbi:TIR domain-containing protein (plasmid) [Sphingobium amiense]|uniref:TIR domain-containing protein n=1 Tax=Sphingobium amiense TaxID=135719 RepID=A0A494WGP3_9SPHN|nr:toll/interleukin-1 receptor domain-containing protein [Sphingobium amiense]BBE00311.1 TIR domain-containing protein [Sphingobium amiense]
MIEYITKSELRNFAGKLNINEQVNLRKSASSRALSGATFLSHSSKDDDLVVGAIRVLEGHGAKVYVDEIDPEMPPYTTEETAGLLKSRIRQTKRFVLLASKNSKDSRWVPWELGVADGC